MKSIYIRGEGYITVTDQGVERRVNVFLRAHVCVKSQDPMIPLSHHSHDAINRPVRSSKFNAIKRHMRLFSCKSEDDNFVLL